jgi:hypothetical protein
MFQLSFYEKEWFSERESERAGERETGSVLFCGFSLFSLLFDFCDEHWCVLHERNENENGRRMDERALQTRIPRTVRYLPVSE